MGTQRSSPTPLTRPLSGFDPVGSFAVDIASERKSGPKDPRY
jgi:hypothetical protein